MKLLHVVALTFLFGFYFDFFRGFGETKMKEQARTPNEEARNTATLKGVGANGEEA
jgi:hypothetical protein